MPATAASASPGSIGSWSWRLPYTPSAARTARLNVSAALRHVGVEKKILDDARVVVSEFLGNALRHARARVDGALTVDVEVSEDEIRISVADGGSATLPTLINPLPLASNGRGLAIVQSLTETWGVREGPTGNVVYGVLSRG